MGIVKTDNGSSVIFSLQGETLLTVHKGEHNGRNCISLDGAVKTLVSPCFAEVVEECMMQNEDFVLDFGGVSYIASAGLRVLLNMQQKIDDEEKISVKIINVSDSVREVLESTGFINILDIEDK